jgi:hypothetical protein
MRWLGRILTLAIVWGVFSAAAEAKGRVALLIGNSEYKFATNLPNPANDAKDVAASLERLGFEVTTGYNLGFDATRRLLRNFAAKANAAEMAVVFYAGHGMEVNKNNYLIPVDARLATDSDIAYEAVPLELLTEAVRGASELKLVILDACRNNPFAASMQVTNAKRSIGRGLARFEPEAGTLVAYAAREGTVADDGDGRNSPFTRALLSNLETPGLEINFLFRRVRDAVMTATRGIQQPFTYGSLPARSIFLVEPPSEKAKPKNSQEKVASAAPPGRSTPTFDREALYWASVKDSNDAAMFSTYLERFPNGLFADLARARIRQLNALAKPAPVPAAPNAAVAPDVDLKSAAVVAEAKRLLFELNYNPSRTARGLDNATQSALRNFETDAGLPGNGGQLTPATFKALKAARSLAPWGAIVYSAESQEWGAAWKNDSRAGAVAQAQKSCKRNSCDRHFSFFGGDCGAFAHSPSRWSMAAGETVEQARQTALRDCGSGGAACDIVIAFCATGKGAPGGSK